ncbi:hypothetical protein Tco_1425890 [Tanacetum coccineum]
MMEHDSGACIYGALVSVNTNDIFSNNEFPILDVGRKIISKDNGEETIKLNGFELINDVVAKGERGFNVSSFMNEAILKSFEGAFAQVDQGSQIKMIQVKEMMQDNDLKNSKSKDKGSKSRSQSMNEQSRYKQDKTITRQSINVKRHIFNLIGGTEEFEERDLNIGGDC